MGRFEVEAEKNSPLWKVTLEQEGDAVVVCVNGESVLYFDGESGKVNRVWIDGDLGLPRTPSGYIEVEEI